MSFTNKGGDAAGEGGRSQSPHQNSFLPRTNGGALADYQMQLMMLEENNRTRIGGSSLGFASSKTIPPGASIDAIAERNGWGRHERERDDSFHAPTDSDIDSDDDEMDDEIPGLSGDPPATNASASASPPTTVVNGEGVTQGHDVSANPVDPPTDQKPDDVQGSDPTGQIGGMESPDATEKPLLAYEDAPDGGIGWLYVACVFLLNAHTWGLNSSYGVFLAYYLDNEVFPGGSALRYAFVGGLSISMSLLISPLATTVMRVYGINVCLLVGVFFETVSFIGASFATQIWQLFLSQGVCFGWGMGFIYVASVGVIPQWFTTKRSLANATGSAGSGFGGLVYSLAINAAIKSVGLAWSFRILGILSFAVNLTCTLIIRDRQKHIGAAQLAFDYTLFRRFEYNLLQAWGVLSMLGYVVLIFSLPNYATSIGLSAQQGSVISAIFQLGQMLGRPPVGYFSDSFGRINMAATMTFLGGLFTLVIWVFAKSYGVLIFFSLISGSVAGTFWATIAPVGAEVCGLKDLPSALSITWVVLVLPTTFSEAIALEIVQKTSAGYLGAQLFTGFMYIGAALSLWCVRTWKIGELERLEIEESAASSSSSSSESEKKVQRKQSSFWKRIFAWKKV